MVSLPLLNEGEHDLVASYAVDADEEMSEAVVNAFMASGVDVFDQPTSLADWVDPDVFRSLEWSASRPLYLCTRIWNRQVVIAPEEIRIYVHPSRASCDSSVVGRADQS